MNGDDFMAGRDGGRGRIRSSGGRRRGVANDDGADDSSTFGAWKKSQVGLPGR